jgi:hypothetical protein
LLFKEKQLAANQCGELLNFKSGREDLNLRPRGPESSGPASQGPSNQRDTEPAHPVCTPVCTGTAPTPQADTLETLAAALLRLPPADRARLTALLLAPAGAPVFNRERNRDD